MEKNDMKFSDKLFKPLASFVSKKFKLIVIFTFILVILSIVYISTNLEMKSNWKDFLNENDRTVIETNKIVNIFRSDSNISIVVKGKKENTIRFTEALIEKIKSNESLKNKIRSIDYKMNRDFLLKYGFLLQKTEDIRSTLFLFQKLGLIGTFSGINRYFENSYSEVSTHMRERDTVKFLDNYEIFLENLVKYLEGNEIHTQNTAGNMTDALTIGDPYYFSPKSDMLIFTIYSNIGDDYQQSIEFVQNLKKIIAAVLPNHSGVQAALSGSMAMDYDELSAMNNDFAIPSYVAYVLVLIMLIISFKSFMNTLFSMVTLAAGIIVGFAFTLLFNKNINQLSAGFLVMLIGLGIDYAVHIINHFPKNLQKTGDTPKALFETYQDIGLGLIIGAITTSGAFYMFLLSSAKGFKQLGFIAGTGILVCLIFMLIVLPAFIIWRYSGKSNPKIHTAVDIVAMRKLGNTIIKRKILFVSIGFILLVFSIFLGLKLKYDSYYLNQLPQNSPSLKSLKEIVREFRQSADCAMLMVKDIEKARALSKRFEMLDYVGRVESVTYYIPSMAQNNPDNQRERLKAIRKIALPKDRMNFKIISQNDIPILKSQIEDFRNRIIELSYAETMGGLKLVRMKREIIIKQKKLFDRLLHYIGTMDPKKLQKLVEIEKHFSQLLNERIEEMTRISKNDNQFITANSLPENIKNQFIDASGQYYLINIYSQDDIYNENILPGFVQRVTEIHPNVTGVPIILQRAQNLYIEESKKTLFFALFIVFIILIINNLIMGEERFPARLWRSFLKTLLTLVPLIIGVVYLTGLLKLFNIQLNMLNISAFTLLLGMGIDYGVYITERYINEGYTNISHILEHTGKGILLSAITTMIGFGSLAFLSQHNGMASFGYLLFIGIGMCFTVSLIFLPPLLALFLKKYSKIKNTNI